MEPKWGTHVVFDEIGRKRGPPSVSRFRVLIYFFLLLTLPSSRYRVLSRFKFPTSETALVHYMADDKLKTACEWQFGGDIVPDYSQLTVARSRGKLLLKGSRQNHQASCSERVQPPGRMTSSKGYFLLVNVSCSNRRDIAKACGGVQTDVTRYKFTSPLWIGTPKWVTYSSNNNAEQVVQQHLNHHLGQIRFQNPE
jgi:hypothetical protein